MDLSAFNRFPKFSSGQEAYAGDLGERYHAVVNQDTFIEVCTVSTEGMACWSGHIAPLSEHVYDLADFSHKLRGEGVYYRLDTAADVRAFLCEVAMQMVIDRP
jgi:hypothetical protein